ncbi:MAG TPA: alkaline phosphatase family protein [Kofleriaceae bacterium]
MKRALLVILLAACPAPRATPVHHAASGPGLVVLVIIDQFPEWSFERKRTELTHGFARILREGEWRIGRHPSAATLTAPGHALLGTGATPDETGIIANEWWLRDLGKPIKAAEDEAGKTSSKWLRVPGLGDAVAAAHSGAKAVAVSLKNRAAVLPLGHAGLAIYYDTNTASFTAYRGAAPWLPAHNRAHPVTPRLVPWQPRDPARLAQLSGVVDAQPGEVGEKGFGATFPHDPKTTTNPADSVYAMPLGNDLVLETALAAIDGEQLGADDKIDLLIVSLSAHDYIAHGWGHESWEAWDSELRLDEALDHFLAELDRKVGAGRWAMAMTSDHGGSPMPELTAGGRYTDEQIKAAANQAASLVLGPGEWIAYANLPTVYLSKAALAQDPKELANAVKKIVFALRAFPGLAAVDRVDAFAGHCADRQGDARALCLTFDAERSGEVFYLPAKGWIVEEEGERLATAHGSLHDYDRNVPVVLLPFGRKPHPPVALPGAELPLTDVAPLLAGWLGVTPPTALPR